MPGDGWRPVILYSLSAPSRPVGPRSTLEITGLRRRAEPAVAGSVHRRVGRHPWTTSRPDIFHEGGNLHELDGRAHTVETGYLLE
jgi:hypothetical protein